MGSEAQTMKLATLLILSLAILGATAQSPKKRKLLRKCGIRRSFCERGEKPDVRPLEGDCEDYVGEDLPDFEKEDREDCTVGEAVTENFCILCVERGTKLVTSATQYQLTGTCTDDCKRGKESCLDRDPDSINCSKA